MKRGIVVGIVVGALLASGALAVSLRPNLSSLTGTTGGSGSAFGCEDQIEGDRVEIRNETGDQRIEIRVEADTRVRAEARFENSSEWDDRREARIELCGIVQFVDEDGDGMFDSGDAVVRSDLVAFGDIDHRLVDSVHIFETRSEEGNLTVTLQIPAVFPSIDTPLIDWMAVARPACEPDATHFAIKFEEAEPVDRDAFFAAPCGTTLVAPGGETPPPPPVEALECQNLSDGIAFTTALTERDGDVERTLDARVEADTRVRAEVRFENSSGGDDRREARIELCGILEFVDEDGDGRFGPNDTVVSAALVSFDALVHSVDGSFHVFEAIGLDGTLTVTIRVPATFPGPDEPLIQWSVMADPTCEPDATHFAVKLEREEPTQAEEFLVAECGTTLTAAGVA